MLNPSHRRSVWQVLASVYTILGEPRKADQMVKERGQPLDISNLQVALLNIERGNAAAAIPRLRQAVEQGRCLMCDQQDLGRAYDALGQADSARALYERFLSVPDADRGANEFFWRPLILLRVAQLHEAAGDKAMALRQYGELLKLWRNADPILTTNVNAVKARMLALQGAG